MDENELVDELAARAKVAPAHARAVLLALAEVAHDNEQSGRTLPLRAFGLPDWGGHASARLPTPSTPAQVDELIEDARRHPLGIEFLLEGELGSVAATFGVHAFTVDAARLRLAAARS